MPRLQSFNFISAKALGLACEENKIHVSYNASGHMLTFSRKNTEVLGYVGKYVQIYADLEKKTLAWVFAPSTMVKPEELKNYTRIKEYSGNISLYIPNQIVTALKLTKSLKKLEVQKYKPAGYLDSNTYYYVNTKGV